MRRVGSRGGSQGVLELGEDPAGAPGLGEDPGGSVGPREGSWLERLVQGRIPVGAPSVGELSR